MKKKLLIALVLTLCAMFTLTACLQLEKVTNLQLVDAPKTTFAVGEAKATDLTFTVSVDRGEEKILFHYPDDAAKISLSGFSTEVAGTFTATISYKVSEANVLTYTFEYTVTDGFAGGNGTEETPYLIASADQFMMIPFAEQQKEGKTYYKLTSDINFDGVDVEAYQAAMKGFVFNGELNGLKANGVGSYKIMGYRSSYTFGKDDVTIGTVGNKTYAAGLFGFIANGTFKNIDLVDCSVEARAAEGVGLLGIGRRDSDIANVAAFSKEDAIVLENVRTLEGCSVLGAENVGAFIGYGRGYKLIEVKNVENNATVTAIGQNVGGAIGHINEAKGTVIVNNYTNKGVVTGLINVGGFCGQTAGTNTVVNSSNEGILTITNPDNSVAAGWFTTNGTVNATGCKDNGTYYKHEANTALANATVKLYDVNYTINAAGKMEIIPVDNAVVYEFVSSYGYSIINAADKNLGGGSHLFGKEQLLAEAGVYTTAAAKVTTFKFASNIANWSAQATKYAAYGVAAEGETSDLANGLYVTPYDANTLHTVSLVTKEGENKGKIAITWYVTAYNAEGEAIASNSYAYYV